MTSTYQEQRYRAIKARNTQVFLDDHSLQHGPDRSPKRKHRSLEDYALPPYTSLRTTSQKISWIKQEVRRIDTWLLRLSIAPSMEWSQKVKTREEYQQRVVELRQKMQALGAEDTSVSIRRGLDKQKMILGIIDAEFKIAVDTSLRAMVREIRSAI